MSFTNETYYHIMVDRNYKNIKKKYNSEKETELPRFKIQYNKTRDIKSTQI
jgi:hypothetical protein